MPPIAVFFDMDGAMLDRFEAWFAVMNATATHFDRPQISRQAARDALGQSPQADAEQFYQGHSAAAVDAYYIAHFHEGTRLAIATPGAQVLLDELSVSSYPTAIITNTRSEIARPLLEALELIPDALIASDDVKNPLPAPEMIFRGCEVLGITPWDVLVVGGSIFDRQAAAASGSSFAGYGGIAGNFTITDIHDVRAILDGTYG